MVDLSRLPMGFGFSPTDEIIIAILIMIVYGNPQAAVYNSVIHKYNLFGQTKEPSEIWEDFRGDQAHGQQLFFSFKLNTSNKNISRKMGRDGTWSESGKNSKDIEVKTNPNHIGKIRNFRFENKSKSGDHSRWLLQEYSLYEAAAAHGNTKTSKNRYDCDSVIWVMKRNNAGENKRKRSNDPNTNNVEEPQEGCFTLTTNTDHLVLPLPDESNERKRMPDVPYDDDPVNEDMLITNPTNTFSFEEQLAPVDGYQSGIASSENLPPDQMAETLPLRSLGSDRLGADPALDSDHDQMHGNQEEQLPLPTADYAWLDVEDTGEIEVDYQIPSDYFDTLFNLPFEYGTYNDCSESSCNIQLWNF